MITPRDGLGRFTPLDADGQPAGPPIELEVKNVKVNYGSPPCPFCQVARGATDTKILRDWGDTIVFTPLNPVTEGHVLVAPREHFEDFSHSPHVSAVTMNRAAEYADTLLEDINLITSRGTAATQTVKHLHIHLVPRRDGDGLHLPWTA